MVDFNRLRRGPATPPSADPFEVFRRLPRSGSVNDLWQSQAEVLREWNTRRGERDLIIKLNTGGGKTLIGLLIVQSVMNETRGSGLYLCPNRQLVTQTLAKSQEYGIPAVAYETGSGELSDRFLNGQSILIATYQALFNGRSRFGIRYGTRDIVRPNVILLDDAHIASSVIRDQFTIIVDARKHREAYSWMTTVFRREFEEQGRLGTFDDIVSGRDLGVLEVPYWAWIANVNQVRQHLADLENQGEFVFEWPLLRDNFDKCHALISSREFVITPLYPLLHLFPSFSECERRVYMSATLSDDSSLVRTFDASAESVKHPITTTSLAGVGERMILVPSLTAIETQTAEAVAREVIKTVKTSGVVILVPSEASAKTWSDVAEMAVGEDVALAIEKLTERRSNGPYVLPNRYDGIDLSGESCRLLVMGGLPRGVNAYELYRASVLEGSVSLNSSFAQRLEQGMGRASRGAGDFCVVLLVGKDLVSWISRTSNLVLLTPSTRAQLEIGNEISRNVAESSGIIQVVQQCLDRDRDWLNYHADKLAESGAEPPSINTEAVELASKERNAFRLMVDGYFEKAIAVLENCAELASKEDRQLAGWLLQMAGRAARLWNDTERADKLQRAAYASNRLLLRPKVVQPYLPIDPPGNQASRIVEALEAFKFRRGYMEHFEEVVASLVPTASSNQFEEALKNLGTILGFHAERPEREQTEGPDDLWLMPGQIGWVMEAKSQKLGGNPLTKEEHGQVLNSFEWFKLKYPQYTGYKVVVHPNSLCSAQVPAEETFALTLAQLGALVSHVRDLLSELTSSRADTEILRARCQQRLAELQLTAEQLGANFLTPFRNA